LVGKEDKHKNQKELEHTHPLPCKKPMTKAPKKKGYSNSLSLCFYIDEFDSTVSGLNHRNTKKTYANHTQ
jgi:hypothetical protein